MKIELLTEKLDAAPGELSLEAITDIVEYAEISVDDVIPWIKFSMDEYIRNSIRRCDKYELLLLCWGPDQVSPIHDHGGSACAVKLLAGELCETTFARADQGSLRATGEAVLRAGSTTGSDDDDIHRLGNVSPENYAVSLHVYSPPIPVMRTYEEPLLSA